MTNVIDLNEAEFNETILESDETVLVDFFGHFCAPCKMISPILDAISLEKPDFKIYKVDIENNMDLAKQYNIRNIPTLILFENGKIKGTLVGSVTKDKILNLIG